MQDKNERYEELEKRRLLELRDRADSCGAYFYTDFHTRHGVGLAMELSLDREIKVWGGYDEAERCMIRFGDAAEIGYEEPFPISVIHIAPRMQKFAEKLSHRDYLGAIMKLGIERGILGDILLSENAAYVMTVERMAGFITEGIATIRHTPVTCTLVEKLPEDVRPQKKPLSVNVSSLRLDGIISHVFHISRSESKSLFSSERISVGGMPLKSAGSEPRSGDIISVAGHGKFIYCGCEGKTRKGNYVVNIEKFV